MTNAERYSLDALEFEAVREQLGALAATPLGRAKVAALAPCATGEQARALLEWTAEAMRLRALRAAPSFQGIDDLRGPLGRLASGGRPLEPIDLARAARTLRAASVLRAHLARQTDAAPRLAALAAAMPDLVDLSDAIDLSIDARGEVLDTASPKLADARARIRGLEAEIARVLAHVTARPEVRRALNVPKPSFRNHRPVLAVKGDQRHLVPGLLLDRSSTGSTVFIEPEEVVELGNALADASLAAAREVATVLLELSRSLLSRREAIALALDRVADLDLEMTKAAYAESVGAIVPEIAAGRRLRLLAARHPKLLARAASRGGPHPPPPPVPIDIEIGGEFDLVVITGPNTGGKTVALKTVGLLSAMALAGLPVPAAAAEIPAFDGIFVDVGDEQEILQSLSTFSSHLVRVARAVHHATRDSLVLLDEVGAGTDPAEGAALGESILEHFLQRGVRTIATTHLGKLKDLAFRHPRAENATVEFDPETLLPRYRILMGVPGTSQALAVARRMGIPEAILERAESTRERPDVSVEEAVASIQDARIEADAARKRAEALAAEGEKRRRELDDRARAVEERATLIAAEAQREIDDSVRRLRALLHARLDALIASAPKPLDAKLRRFHEELDAAIRIEPIERKREEFLDRLKRDDVIYVPKLRRRCPVRRVNREKRTVTVLVGDLPTDVRFDEVTWHEVL